MRISLLLISMTAAVREKHRQSEGQQEHPARLVVHQHYLNHLNWLFSANMKPESTKVQPVLKSEVAEPTPSSQASGLCNLAPTPPTFLLPTTARSRRTTIRHAHEK